MGSIQARYQPRQLGEWAVMEGMLGSSRVLLEASLPVGGGRRVEFCSGKELGGMRWVDDPNDRLLLSPTCGALPFLGLVTVPRSYSSECLE